MRLFLPFINLGITGFESPAAEYTESALSLDDLLIEHPAATYFGRAVGDSMQGVGIFNGDILIVSRAETATQGDIIVARLNDEFVCKIWDKTDRSLISAAPTAKPYRLKEDDIFQVEGVVVRSIRVHKPLRELPDVFTV